MTESGELLATAFTNTDGRVLAQDFGLEKITAGNYALEFITQPYFAAKKLSNFFPKVVIHFSITQTQQYYHIPLLISPFAYSTHRGSQ